MDANRAEGVVTSAGRSASITYSRYHPVTKISYSGYHFPAEIIQRDLALYPVTLNFRDVEDLPAERGIFGLL